MPVHICLSHGEVHNMIIQCTVCDDVTNHLHCHILCCYIRPMDTGQMCLDFTVHWRMCEISAASHHDHDCEHC